MPEELISLRMLLVGGSDDEIAIWAQGVGRASVPVELFTPNPDARDLPDGLDIVVIDAALSEAAVAAAVEATRVFRPPPLVVLCGSPRQWPQGIEGVVPCPAVAEEARRLTDRLIRARLPNRTLIVDDSSTMRGIVRKILSGCRFPLALEESPDGESALRSLESARYGLAFVDYNMPGYNGIDLLKELRRQHEKLGVIVMTSSLDAALAEQAIAAGALAFLKKPFYPTDIDGVLARYYGLNG